MIRILILLMLTAGALASPVRHELLPLSGGKGKVEVFWKSPDSPGKYPVFILVHGHQGSVRMGASVFAKEKVLDAVSAGGMIAAAVSQSGYGETSGEPDHAGRNSQDALRSVIRFFRQHASADPSRIIVYGSSMGATLTAITAVQEPDLAAVILENGMYDVEAALHQLWFRSQSDPELASLYGFLDQETGNDKNRFEERSALFHADRMKVPVLILAGLGDDIALPDQSLRFHERIQAAGGTSGFILYPFAGHNIPLEMKNPDISRFLQRFVK